MKAIDAAIRFLHSVKDNRKTPPEGRYMTYKEILSLAFGSLGAKFLVYCFNSMTLYVGDTLIGNTIGIEPRPLYVIYISSVLSGFPLTALRARMIDNSRSMMEALDALFDASDRNELAKKETLDQIKAAKETKDKASVPALKERLKELRKEKSAIDGELKAAMDGYALYMRAAKPYAQAKKLIKMKETYGRIDEIIGAQP